MRAALVTHLCGSKIVDVAILQCGYCKQMLPSTSFNNTEQRKGAGRKCRPCWADYMRDYRARNPDRNRVYAQRYRDKPETKEKMKRRDHLRRSTEEGKLATANRWFKYRYGLTLQDVESMIEAQDGLCAICGKPETKIDARTGEVRRLSVDHDHRTGKPRSMLCMSCNWFLARVDDDVDRLQGFIDYLELHRSRSGQTPGDHE
jgi:hypothetical protein